MIVPRKLTDIIQKTKKSILLLGPRQTGKSTLIGGLKPDLSLNLAREATFLDLASNPTSLEEQVRFQQPKSVFIDEVQRLPELLNTVQVLIDEWRGGPHSGSAGLRTIP